jgi:hypothetical protein
MLHTQMTRGITVGVDVGAKRRTTSDVPPAAHQASNIDVINRSTAEKSDFLFFISPFFGFYFSSTVTRSSLCQMRFALFILLYLFFVCDKHTSVAVYSRWTSSNAPCLVPCVCRVSLNSFLFLSGPILWVGGWKWDMERIWGRY